MTGPRHAAIAAEIRSELGRQEVTRRELARRIGKPDTTVARWLRNGTAMDLDDIYVIADALTVDPLDLIRRAHLGDLESTGTNGRYAFGARSVADFTGYLIRRDSPVRTTPPRQLPDARQSRPRSTRPAAVDRARNESAVFGLRKESVPAELPVTQQSRLRVTA